VWNGQSRRQFSDGHVDGVEATWRRVGATFKFILLGVNGVVEDEHPRRSRGALDQLAHFRIVDLPHGRVVPEISHGRRVLLQAEAHAFERRRLVELPRVRHLDGPRLDRINQIALVLSIDIAARGKLRVRLLVVEMGGVAWGFSAAPDGERPGSPLHAADGAEQECQRERSSQPHGCVRNSESFGLPPNLITDHDGDPRARVPQAYI
jgi:hypothetical protein